MSRFPSMVNALTSLGGLVLLFYALLVASAFVMQRRIMYPAPRMVTLPSSSLGKLVTLTHRAGGRVHAFYVPAAKGRRTVVILHGNGEQLSDQMALVGDLAQAGLGSFAVEYPGYGLSAATVTTEANVYRDVDLAISYLRQELDIPNDELVLYGRSLGSAVAVEMASRGHGCRMILVSAFTSMMDLAARAMPLIPARWLVLDRYDIRSKASRIQHPTLLVHGAIDTLVPVEMSERLRNLIPYSTIYVIPGADHNGLLEQGGSGLLEEMILFANAPC